MYAQVEKPKDNKSRAIANSVAQKKSNGGKSFGFVDNRPEAITQRKLQEMANNNLGAKQLRGVNAPSPIYQSEVVQRVIIGETDITSASDISLIKTALGWSSLLGITVSLTIEQKASLLTELSGRDDCRDIIEQLEPEESSDESLSSSASAEPEFAVNKVDLARQIITTLRTDGLPVFLSGGGAVTLSGGPRAIKDLDLRVDLSPERTFSVNDELSQGLIDGINRLLQSTFDHVDPLTRSDEHSGMTIAGHVNGVEVSITRTPLVENMSLGPDASGIVRLGEFDLIMDKAYSFAMRRKGDFEKRITDLIDMLSLIDNQRGLVNVFRGLNALRGAAYGKQAEMANKRAGKVIYDPDLLLEFHVSLNDMMKKYNSQVKGIMQKYNALQLYPLINFVITETGKYLDKTMPITVI